MLSCLFCGDPDYPPGTFCQTCGSEWSDADPLDRESALHNYKAHLRDSLFEEGVKPLKPGSNEAQEAVRKRLKVSFGAAQKIRGELAALHDQVKPLLDLELQFDANLNGAYANADTKLRFRLKNTSAEMPIQKAALFWDDPDWEDDRDFLATAPAAVRTGGDIVISHNHVFKRGGDKSISHMFLRITRFGDSALLRLHTFDFFVGNPNVSVQNIIHNTNTTQVSVEGTGAIFKAGEIGNTATRVTEEATKEARWVPVAFSYVFDDEFDDPKVQRAASDLQHPMPQRDAATSARAASSHAHGLVSSSASVSPAPGIEVAAKSAVGHDAPSLRPGELTCAGCGSALKPGARFCFGCGTPAPQAAGSQESASASAPATLRLFCGACGAEGAPGAKFCPDCGGVFGTQPPAAATPQSAVSAALVAPVAPVAPAAAPAAPVVSAAPAVAPASESLPEAAEPLPDLSDLTDIPTSVAALLSLCRRFAADRTVSIADCTFDLMQSVYTSVPDPDLEHVIGILVHDPESIFYDNKQTSLIAGFSGTATVFTHWGVTQVESKGASIEASRSDDWRHLQFLEFALKQFGRGSFIVSLTEGFNVLPGGLYDLRLRPIDNVQVLCNYGNEVLERLRVLDQQLYGHLDHEDDEEDEDEDDAEDSDDQDDDSDLSDDDEAASATDDAQEWPFPAPVDPALAARWGAMKRFFSVFSFTMQRCSEKQARAIYSGDHVSDDLLLSLWSAANMSGSGMVVVCIEPSNGEFSIDGKLTGWRGNASVLSLEGVYHMARGDQGDYKLDGFNAFLSWSRLFNEINADLFIREVAADIWFGTPDKYFLLGSYCEYASNVLQWDYFEEFVKQELLASFEQFKQTVLQG